MVKVPVIGVGRMDLPEMAIRAIDEGTADMVAVGRGLLADPFWPNKVMEDRYMDIRPCLGCQYGCMYRLRQKKPLSCTMNPACGREKSYGIEPAKDKKRQCPQSGPCPWLGKTGGRIKICPWLN